MTRQPRGILTSLAWLKELFSHDGAMWLLLLRKDRSERDALEISHVLVKSKEEIGSFLRNQVKTMKMTYRLKERSFRVQGLA